MPLERRNRLFSRTEADQLIPELEQRLGHLQRRKEVYRRAHDALFLHELVCAAEKAQGVWDAREALESGIHDLEEAIEGLAGDLEEVLREGVILRDIEKGYIDFRSKMNGREIYLSWKPGEARVQFYRLRGEALSERRLLPDSNISTMI